MELLDERHSIRQTPDGRIRIDTWFQRDRRTREMLHFSINVSLTGEAESEDVYRVDTAHGHLHEQRFWESPAPIELAKERFSSRSRAFEHYRRIVDENFERWTAIYRLRKREEREQSNE